MTDLEFQQHIESEFARIKRDNLSMPVDIGEKSPARLRPISQLILTDALAHELAVWRNREAKGFFTEFPMSPTNTKAWLSSMIQKDDRALFLIEVGGRAVGHMGLFNVNTALRSMEVDNVLRGVGGLFRGMMTVTLKSLLEWAFWSLDLEQIGVTTFADNTRAKRLYEACGFVVSQYLPLRSVQTGNRVEWIKATDDFVAERMAVYMTITRQHDMPRNSTPFRI